MQQNPQTTEGHALLAEAFVLTLTGCARTDKTIARATDLHDCNAEVHRVRGYLAESHADYEAAIVEYQRAVVVEFASYSYLYLNLGHALRVSKRYDEALGLHSYVQRS